MIPLALVLLTLMLRQESRRSRSVLESIHALLSSGRDRTQSQFTRGTLPDPRPSAPKQSTATRNTKKSGSITELRSSQPCVPMAEISEGVIGRLFNKFHSFENIRPGCETTCSLGGQVEGKGPGRKIVIRTCIDEGPEAELSPGHATPDRNYQQTVLELYQLLAPRIGPMGVAHRHPGRMDRCSEGDRATDVPLVRSSATREMIFCIATYWKNGIFGSVASHEITRGEFKLSFYYLSEATGDQYLPARIETSPMPSIQLPPPILQMAEANPVRTRREFSSLGGLREYVPRFTTLELGGVQSACLTLEHKVFQYTVSSCYPESNPFDRRVIVSAGEEVVELASESETPLAELLFEFEQDYIRRLGCRGPESDLSEAALSFSYPLTRPTLHHQRR